VTGHQPRAWAAIDLLRFACALLVVARHYCAALPLRPNPVAAAMLANVTLDARWSGWTSFGWIGVELFFVISGYVIASSAVGAEPGAFLRRRAQRLLPAAWVCATISFAVLLAMQAAPAPVLGGQWLRAMSFWPLGDAIDPSYWTLGVEAAFYLLIAWRLRRGATPERIERVAWWIGGASLVFWLAQIALGTIDGTWMQERLAQLLLLPHGAFFATGILLQAWHRSGAAWRRSVGIALFVAAGAVEITAHTVDQAAGLGASTNPVPPLLLFGAGVLLIAGCRRVQPWLGWTGTWAATLGLMTYPLYLLHQQIGAAVVAISGANAFPAALALVLALSWAVVRFAEPPLRRWIGAVSARHALRRDIPLTASP
jgi:peptidoglycan/LPS O-acetylase OafA/YrhL